MKQYISSNVFNVYGEYGGDQTAPYKTHTKYPTEYTELYDIVKFYFPKMTDEDVNCFLEKLNREGCGYVAMINSLFNEFIDKPQEFKKIFGFNMYSSDGTLSFNNVLVDLYCSEDNHNKESFLFFTWDVYKEKEDFVWDDPDKDGVYEWIKMPHGNNQTQMKYRWERYCQKYGLKTDIIIDANITPKNYEKHFQKGVISILCSNFTLYDEAGVVKHVKNGHFMTITGVTHDNTYIVSSWGAKYILNPADIKGFTHYQIIRYELKK